MAKGTLILGTGILKIPIALISATAPRPGKVNLSQKPGGVRLDIINNGTTNQRKRKVNSFGFFHIKRIAEKKKMKA